MSVISHDEDLSQDKSYNSNEDNTIENSNDSDVSYDGNNNRESEDEPSIVVEDGNDEWSTRLEDQRSTGNVDHRSADSKDQKNVIDEDQRSICNDNMGSVKTHAHMCITRGNHRSNDHRLDMQIDGAEPNSKIYESQFLQQVINISYKMEQRSDECIYRTKFLQ